MPSRQPAEPVLSEVQGTPALVWSGFGCSRLRDYGLRHCCRFSRRSNLGDRDVVDLNRAVRPIVGIASHVGDLLHQGNCGLIALAEDGVSAIQAGVRNLSNKELRAVRVGTRVGIRQAPGTVKLQIWGGLILERETNVAAAAAGRI